MPLYEYICRACGRKSTILVRKKDEESGLSCRHCGEGGLRRVLSRFAVHKTEASRLKELDAGQPADDSYYRDDRNIGMRAKKRMQELGVDLGDSFNEKLEKARTGKLDDL